MDCQKKIRMFFTRRSRLSTSEIGKAAQRPVLGMVALDSGSDSDSSDEAGANVDWLAVVRREPSVPSAVVHEGFFCDGCAADDSEPSPIVGVRYSRNGEEYDLCSACFAQLSPTNKHRYTALNEALPVDDSVDGDSGMESEYEEENNDFGARGHTPAATTSALDAKIADLEAFVDGGENSSDSSDSSDSDDEHVDVTAKHKVSDFQHNRDAAAVPQLERIQPLSQESLPEFYRKSKVRKGNAAAAEAAVSAAAAAIAYEKAEKRSLYCRVCKQKFETVETLQQHRATREHKAAEERDRDGSYCPLCDKQFTSPDQLREHVRGKWHQAREEAAVKGKKFVAPGKQKAKRRGNASGSKVTSSRAPGGGTLGAKMRAANAPAPEKKPLVVRFGTETGGQIKVKGHKKVLGGLREKPAAKSTGSTKEKTRDSRQQHGNGSNESSASNKSAPTAHIRTEGKSRKRQRSDPVAEMRPSRLL